MNPIPAPQPAPHTNAARDAKPAPDAPPAFAIYCRVVDNFGDAGVCWRLARQLAAEHGCEVSLWIDRPDTLAAIEPRARDGRRLAGVLIRRWQPDAMPATTPAGASAPVPPAPPRPAAQAGAEVVPAGAATVAICAFGCELPAAVRARIAAGAGPLWVHLEYLSAEDWVEGCHGLTSARPSDGALEHFFYPGFTTATGGLLRERGLLQAREAFRAAGEGSGWLAARGLGGAPGERLVSLFCYPDAPVAPWLALLARSETPARVLVPAGIAVEALEAFLGEPLPVGAQRRRGSVRIQRFPLLPQDDYDRLLWSCDLNFVRGEDSWIRAHWAGQPFVWQPYPQAEDTHLAKLAAFLKRFASADGAPAGAAADMMLAWSGRAALAPAWERYERALPDLAQVHRAWSAGLARQPDLASVLLEFCRNRLYFRV